MWTPWQPLLFLAIVLIPDPGVSQYSYRKECLVCTGKEIRNNSDSFKHKLTGKGDQYWKCNPTDIVRFQLQKDKKEVICADRKHSWVKDLMVCTDNGKKCFDEPVTSVKPSTRSWDHKTGQSTQPAEPGAATPSESLVASSVSHTSPLGKANINLQQGNGKPSDDSKVEDPNSKMQHMRTTIISLMVIILVMVAVGLGVYCRKKRTNVFNAPCGSKSIEYINAPSEESILEVKAEN